MLVLVTLVLLVVVLLVTGCSVALRVAAQESLRAALDRAAPADRVVVVAGGPDATGLERADDAVVGLLRSELAPAGVEVTRRTRSASYALRGGADGDRVVLGLYPDAPQHATLVAGAWPATEQPDGVAVPASAARALRLEPGDDLTVVDTDGRARELEVTGVWRADDPADGYWAEDALGQVGLQTSGSFRTVGPLLLPAGDAAFEGLADPRVSWVATPRLSGLSAVELGRVGDGLERLEESGVRRLGEDLPDAEVVSRADDVVRGLDAPLAVARTAVAVPALLLLALGVASVLLAGRVLGEARAGDVRLRGSRGWSRAQVARDTALELGVPTLVVLAVAPWLAPPLVAGVLALTGAGTTSTDLQAGDWLWATTAAVTALAVLVRAGGLPAPRHAASGWRRLVPDLRLVLEVVAVVLAVAAWQQSTATGSDPGGLAVTAAPVLLVVALLLVLSRVVPWAVGAAAAALSGVRRSRGLVGPVAAWELTRRPDRHRPLLVATGLAAATTVLLAGLVGSWASSQDQQAAVTTAAPVRVTGLTTDQAAEVADAGDGISVERREVRLGDGSGVLLALPAREAPAALDPPEGADWVGPIAALASGPADDESVPALVSRAVADRTGGGDSISVRLDDTTLRLRVVGVLDELPTVGPDDAGLLVDGEALRRALGRVPGRAVASDDTEAWVRSDPGGPAPAGARVLVREQVAEELRSGPVGTGLLAGSTLALGAALLVGVLATLAGAASSLRARQGELAALRAQGLARRDVVASVLLERTALLLLAVALGGATGALVLRLLLERLVVTDTGAAVAPAAEVSLPWLPLLAAGGVVLAVLLALVLGAAVRAARRPLGTDLREPA